LRIKRRGRPCGRGEIEARREPRERAESATGSSAKGIAHVPQQPCRRSSWPLKGSISLPLSFLGDRIDGEIAPAKVLLERDVGRACTVKPL